MLFFLLCLYISLYYIRPFEWSESLQGIPVFFSLGVVSILAILLALLSGKVKPFRYKTDMMMAGFVAAIALSHLISGYVGGVVNSVSTFLPSIVAYFLVVYGLDSKKKIHGFVLLLTVLTCFLAYEAYVQSTQGMTHGGMLPYIQSAMGPDGIKIGFPRARWFGPFNDPNDLGLALVLPVAFLLERLLNRKYLLPVLCLPLLLYGLYLTNSRGAMLSLLASVFAFLILRYRSMKGAVLGLALAAVLLLLGPSRMVQLTGVDESAYGRVDAWHEGFQMFKSSPLFGVGKDMFTDFHPITAHNTYMLVLAELGVFGLFFFIGLFYDNILVGKMYLQGKLIPKEDDSNAGMLCSTLGSLAGLMVAITFLSRAYIGIIYMMIAFTTVIVSNFTHESNCTEQRLYSNRQQVVPILGVVFFVIIGFNIVIKVLI